MVVKNQKPRIALIADSRGWVFDNLANIIANHLSDTFDFEIFFSVEFKNAAILLEVVQDFDLVHYFYRQDLIKLLTERVARYFEEKNLDYPGFVSEVLPRPAITTSIFDHLFLKDADILEYIPFFSFMLTSYSVSSKKLEDIYKQIRYFPAPNKVIADGINLEFFCPRNLERLAGKDRELAIGWAGNSRWGMEWDGKDHKGLQTIVKVAVKELRQEGLKIRGCYADREVSRVKYEDMPDYYNSLDIFTCASDIEGTPNTILEAMACGLPIVSTNVGIVPEVFGPLQKEFIVSERNAGSFKEKIRQLIENPDLRTALSRENLQQIQSWSWEAKTREWREFFIETLKIKDLQRQDNEDLPLVQRPIYRQFMMGQQTGFLMYRLGIQKEIEKATLDMAVEANRAKYELNVILNSNGYKTLVMFRESLPGKLFSMIGRAILSLSASIKSLIAKPKLFHQD